MKWDESLSAEWKKNQQERRKEAETAQKSKETVAKALDSLSNGLYGVKSTNFNFPRF